MKEFFRSGLVKICLPSNSCQASLVSMSKPNTTEGKLDSLTTLVTKLSVDLAANMKTVNENLGNITKKIFDVEERVDKKIEGLCKSFKDDMERLKTDFKEETDLEMDTKIKCQVDPIKVELYDLHKHVEEYEQQLKNAQGAASAPFHPDRSIVTYGLKKSEEACDMVLVNNLLSDTLELEV